MSEAVLVGDNVYVLDLKGRVCPYPQLATLRAIRALPPGSTLEVITDNPPSCENVPAVARREGKEVLGVFEVEPGVWKIVIRL
ncbi:putative redox protein, regulator of disulfide bond formation [Pyrobaculum oguniense TE7]|uniref:Redox protein, regulator of disulfide bond formation n=1 Tax=Pyrobaculum oguniense (strain DSM 13380 / JCM 10595 / TE7) TaxID=698757 RepID=H6Q9Z9_PYROT|nr:putative redox protein, regulator of disulfide bond formation [Pyrobaculum oguniense TE7]